MPATVWSPAPYIAKQEWLLQDGSIVASPDFEATSSGRRVRIVGTTASIGSRQVADLIVASMDKIAADQGTKRWLRIFDLDTEQKYRAAAAGYDGDVFKTAATLHLNTNSQNAIGKTTLLWDFQADGLPLAATVFCTLDQRNTRMTVTTKVIWRDTSLIQGQDVPNFFIHDGTTLYLNDVYRYSDEFRAVEALLTKAGGILGDLTRPAKTYDNQFRQAIVDFAERGKALDSLSEISLPDLRDTGNPQMLTFKRKASNYSASVHNELLALVQTGPLLERMQTAYQELTGAMRQLGVVFTHTPGDVEFAAAVAGDLTTLAAQVKPSEDTDAARNNDSLDHMHTVTLDFASGSVIVNCAHTSVGMDEVAEAWNIARFKADLTGETDILLEYAKAYKDPKEQARIKKIIQQRATPDTL